MAGYDYDRTASIPTAQIEATLNRLFSKAIAERNVDLLKKAEAKMVNDFKKAADQFRNALSALAKARELTAEVNPPEAVIDFVWPFMKPATTGMNTALSGYQEASQQMRFVAIACESWFTKTIQGMYPKGKEQNAVLFNWPELH